MLTYKGGAYVTDSVDTPRTGAQREGWPRTGSQRGSAVTGSSKQGKQASKQKHRNPPTPDIPNP